MSILQIMRLGKNLDSIQLYSPGKNLPGSLKLSSNENPLGSSPRAQEALKGAQLQVYPQMISEELRQGIARARSLRPEQVICGNGSNEIFTLCAAATIERGTNAVGSEHSFSQYRFATELFGGEFRSLPTQGLAYDMEAIVSAIGAQTRLVFLSSPNNPTGLLIPAEELRWALESIPEHVLVLIDQAYAEYVDDPSFLDAKELLSEHPNLVVTRSFSKIFGLAALRVGYGLASERLIRQLHRLKPPFNVNGLAQRAALAALSDTAFIDKSKELNTSSKALLYEGLQKLGLEFCESQGNFICIRNPAGRDLAELLQQHRITVRSLASFGLPEYIRMTIPTMDAGENILGILGS